MVKSSMAVRTRIAPSPTGEDLHIGNIYTGLLNFAFARKNSGQFIIRIEDTDRERYVENSEERILASLKTFGLMYDEGPDIGGPFAPYRQSERLESYSKYAEELIKKGHAYYCFCTKERLEEVRRDQIAKKQQTKYDKHCLINVKDASERVEKGEKYVVRLKVPEDREITFEDEVRGEIKINSGQLDDQVLLKSDGYPTYHLGVVVDDHLMEINYIIRAEEWISSTPKHVLLYEFLGWELPKFAHVPLLRNQDHSKLSKRKNPVWASWYIEHGYLPEAILNFLALLGWSHPEEKEIFSLDEFSKLFNLKDLHPVGPVFDLKKLDWMNGVYIREVLSNEELKKKLVQYYKDESEISEFINNDVVLELAKTRMTTLADFKELVTQVSINGTDKKLKDELSTALAGLEVWKKDNIFETFKTIMSKHELKMPALYEIFTGRKQGLPLPDFLEAIGKEQSLARLLD